MFLSLKIPLSLGLGLVAWLVVPSTQGEQPSTLYQEARKIALGEGGVIDEKKSKALILRAADLGEPKAEALKAFWIFSGEKGFQKNESQGKRSFQALTPVLRQQELDGDQDAACLLAYGNLLMLLAGGDELIPLQELAMAGNREAMVILAWAYRSGTGTQAQPAQAFAWAVKAAEKNHPQGMYWVGAMLLEGKGVARDPAKGLFWMQKVADKGLAQAQNLLGELFCQGQQVPADLAQSSSWLRRAAEQDHAKAAWHLAGHYFEGKGVPLDWEEASRWLTVSEAHGWKDASGLRQRVEKAQREVARKSDHQNGGETQTDDDFTGGDWLIAGAFDLPPGHPKDFFTSFELDQFPLEMVEGEKMTHQAATRTIQKVKAQPRGFSFDRMFGRRTNCFAVARLSVDGGAGGRRLITVGSDDAVKIWLNGKKIHEDWIARSLQPGEDFVLAEFRPGPNEISVFVQNFGGPWGLALEVPGAQRLNGLLRQHVLRGDAEKARMLLQAGADPNGKCLSGFLNHTETARFMRRQHLTRVLQEYGGKIRWYHPIWYPRLVSWVAPWLAKMDSRPSPGLSLLVTRDGKTLMELCWGFAHIETGSKITPATRFPIGSITKQFTAAAILRLQEEGKLNLTNRLSQYFPSFPRGDQIRLRQILDHTSGIYNYTIQSDFRTRSLTPAEGTEVLKYIEAWPFGDYPGRRFDYSNSNHYLAGLIVEKVSGQTLGNYFAKEFFEPIGMKRTSLGEGDQLIPDMAAGYSGKPGQVERANMWNFSWVAGAGGIVSTPRDLDLWLEALHGGKVLRSESLREMFRVEPTSFSAFAQSSEGYACGVFIDAEAGQTFISHTGFLPPYCASATRMEELKVNVIILTNGDQGFENLDTGWLQAGLLSLFFNQELGPSQKDQEGPPLSPELVTSLVGSYDDGQTVYELSKQDTRWFFKGGGGKDNLRLIAQDKWVCRDCGKTVTAIRNRPGEVGGLEIKAGLETTFAVKKPAWNPFDPQNLQRLTDYPGKYHFEKNEGHLTIKLEDGFLFVEWPPQGPQLRLRNVGIDEFIAPGQKVRLNFERGPDGRISRLIQRNGGYTWELGRQTQTEGTAKTPGP